MVLREICADFKTFFATKQSYLLIWLSYRCSEAYHRCLAGPVMMQLLMIGCLADLAYDGASWTEI